MTLTFRGKPITQSRLGWWLRIVLTKIFGRKVMVEGRAEPMRILPWIHRGKLLLMGAEHDSLQVYFTTPYTAELRSCAEVKPVAKVAGGSVTGGHEFIHTILCHQDPATVEAIYQHHRKLSQGDYQIIIAYGGPREDYDQIHIADKFFVADPSLRGPSHRTSHWELLSGALQVRPGTPASWHVFSESDLVPLRDRYFEPVAGLAARYDFDFFGKSIREITSSSNGFFADAVERGIAGPTAPDTLRQNLRYYHCIGCFFGVRSTFLAEMIRYCQLVDSLYFEVMIPTAALAAGCVPLSMDAVSPYLGAVRYRPFHTLEECRQLAGTGGWLAHPLKGQDLQRFILPTHIPETSEKL